MSAEIGSGSQYAFVASASEQNHYKQKPHPTTCVVTPRTHLLPSHTSGKNDWFSSAYLSGNSSPDTSHLVYEVDVAATPSSTYKRTITAFLDTGATANFIHP